jgi:hypothetical protein
VTDLHYLRHYLSVPLKPATSLQMIVGDLKVVFIRNTKVYGQVTDPNFEKS